ncbi:MAG: transcription antitermination factor NusB [Oleiphilaceae bacterium]|nr:transcription antitermination factor NusB [Oleiphilaceae bacterium]
MTELPSDKSKQPAAPTTSQRKRARKLVLQALYQWHVSQNTLSQIEAEFRTDNDFEKVDGAYFSELFHGIPKQLSDLDGHIAPLLDRELDQLDPIELMLLRMGTYEFAHRIDVPYRVVINEAVELAKQFGGTDGHKYVNSVLDKLSLRLRAVETRPRQS